MIKPEWAWMNQLSRTKMTKQERIEHISNALNESGAYKKLEYFLVYEDETNDFLLTDMENFAYDLEEFIEGWANNK